MDRQHKLHVLLASIVLLVPVCVPFVQLVDMLKGLEMQFVRLLLRGITVQTVARPCNFCVRWVLTHQVLRTLHVSRARLENLPLLRVLQNAHNAPSETLL